MGSGFSRLFPCINQNQKQDYIFTASEEPLDETLGHSFCYVRSSARFLSPSHSDRLSPSQSLRLSPSHKTGFGSGPGPATETGSAFKSISGASVSANTSTPRTVLQHDQIYDDATATDSLFPFPSTTNISGFESTSNFSALPLQPIPRGDAERGFFMSGPIERGALSGPLLDPSGNLENGGQIHFSAPLNGLYVKRRRKKGFSGIRKAFHSEKKRPWVVPVLNFVGKKDGSGQNMGHGALGRGDLDVKGESNVQWAHGKAGEDRVHVVVSEEHGWLYVGIYDGFNGPDAPEFLMGNLYRAVFNELEGLFWDAEEKGFQENGGNVVNGSVGIQGNEGIAENGSMGIGENEGNMGMESTDNPENEGNVKKGTMGFQENDGNAVNGLIGNGSMSIQENEGNVEKESMGNEENEGNVKKGSMGIEEIGENVEGIGAENVMEVMEGGEECDPPVLNSGSVKRVTFQSEKTEIRSRRPLWEFLAEEQADDGLDLSGSDRFAFSVDDALRASNVGSSVKKRSMLLSKLKYGFSKYKEGQGHSRRFFPWKYDWEDKEKTEVDNTAEERTCQSLRKRRVGPVDHELVLSALSRALDVTELAYLDMTDKVLDRNPELALMGSCLLVVLMRDEDVYVMNVGDSRAIVAQYQPLVVSSSITTTAQGNRSDLEGIVEESNDIGERVNPVVTEVSAEEMKLTALQLSTDHSTSIEEEVLRIKQEHPDDNQCIVNDRVKGRLKVTRAFGAGFLKQPKLNEALLEMFKNEYIGTAPYISCSPSLCHHKLGQNDQFLILSSDGLYQYLSNEEVVSHVESFMEKFPDGDPAQHLIEELLFRAAKKAGMDFHELLDIPQGDRRKYHDDVTVMVISLEGRIWKSSGKYL